MFGFTSSTKKAIDTADALNNNADEAITILDAPAAGTEDEEILAASDDDCAFIVDSDSQVGRDDESSNFTFFEDVPTKESTQGSAIVDPLDVSLHTTCSDASIALTDFLKAMEATTHHATKEADNASIVENEDALSLHASQMGSSDLKEATCALEGAPVEEVTTTSDAKNDQPKEEPTAKEQDTCKLADPKPASFLVRNKFWIVLIFLLGSVARGINHRFVPSRLPEPPLPIVEETPAKMVIHEDETTFQIGGFTYRKETIDSSSSGVFGMWQFALFGLLAKLLVSSKKPITDDSNDDESRADSDASSSVDGKEDISAPAIKYESVPSLIPIKLAEDDLLVSSYNLSKYEDLKVVELQALLRCRKCNYTGRKSHLIRRLASVYRSELQTLTVVQLRKKLKSRNMKQGGLKRELVQKLVEAGF